MSLVQCFIMVIFTAALYVTMRYYLNMLQEQNWQTEGYFRLLMRDSLRWLPLLFVLVPSAALWMDYRILGKMLLLLYLLAILLLYSFRLLRMQKREQGPNKDKIEEKREGKKGLHHILLHPGRRLGGLIGLWLVLWCFVFLWGLLLPKNCKNAMNLILGMAFLLQPLAAPLLRKLAKPVEWIMGRRYVKAAWELLQRRHGLKIVVVTGSRNLDEMGRILAAFLSRCSTCRLEERVLHTAVDAAQVIHELPGLQLEVLICLVQAASPQDLQQITDILHPELLLQVSKDAATGDEHAELRGMHGIILINGDDKELMREKHGKKVVTFGFDEHCHVKGTILESSSEGTRFTLPRGRRAPEEYTTILVGRQQLRFLIGAITAARMLGADREGLPYQAAIIPQTPHHMQLINIPNATWIDDMANEDPAQAIEAVQTLRQFGGEHVLLTSGLLGLGKAQESVNYHLGYEAAQTCSYIILIGEDVAFGVKSGIMDAGFRPENLLETPTLEEAKKLGKELGAAPEGRVFLAEAIRN